MQFVKKISLNRSSRSILMFKSRKKKKGIYTATTQEKKCTRSMHAQNITQQSAYASSKKSITARVLGLALAPANRRIKHSSSEK